MIQTIGFITIGMAPRDDVVPPIRRHLPSNIRVVERGNLNGLTDKEIAALAPQGSASAPPLVFKTKEGRQGSLCHQKILPRMQRLVDELVRDEQANLIVILCGADWSALRCPVPIVNPGRLFPSVLSGLVSSDKRLGVILPSPKQIESECGILRKWGISCVGAVASPYESDRLEAAFTAASSLRHCDLIWMTCIGMDEEMRSIVAQTSGKPVLLAQSLLGRVIEAML
ncbi:hypothetical protein CO683_41070 [Bradyrhizobium ottawaense]|uniref:AroM family protein n=1 Tax=Bradyrhizobium ottawaense TaxID=931866 RepID=UPI000BE8C1A3|nr:AroM family protein [Bradyrhizobium ottawaense]PDT63992.1 hypothetical protein CO683_41070 [Bradyrhizobium ottawaense]